MTANLVIAAKATLVIAAKAAIQWLLVRRLDTGLRRYDGHSWNAELDMAAT